MFSELTHPYYCWICGNAVDLQTCITDEAGMAVHEDCYAARLALNEAMKRTKKPSASSPPKSKSQAV